MNNLVIFKGNINGITAIVDKEAPFENIIESFSQKLLASKNFFNGAEVTIRFQGRIFSEEEQETFIELLKNQNILNVSLIHPFNPPSDHQTYQQWILDEVSQKPESLTYFHYGIVRSGQTVHYDGTIVILGDVNPGGIVTANGHVIVLGNLQGKVHAGLAEEVSRPFVVALNMQPIQIAIAHIIAQYPQADRSLKKKDYLPQIAYIEQEKMYIDEIDFKSLNRMLE